MPQTKKQTAKKTTPKSSAPKKPNKVKRVTGLKVEEGELDVKAGAATFDDNNTA